MSKGYNASYFSMKRHVYIVYMYRRDSIFRDTDISGVQERCTGVVYRKGVQEWCTGSVYRIGVHDQCTGLVYRIGVHQSEEILYLEI